VATAVSVLFPSIRGTAIENLPELEGVAIPFTVTVAKGSLTVPLTVTGLEFRNAKFDGTVSVTIAGASPVTLSTMRLEKIRFRLPRTAAETRNVIGKGLGSVRVSASENVRSPATESPCVPSS
jgi:hypothetical protein